MKDNVTSEKEAVNICKDKDKATLLTIDNESEQDFINLTLAKYEEFADNVWLGLKKKNGTRSTYVWPDGKARNFTNWEDTDEDSHTLECVTMSLGKASLGKWVDEKCSRMAMPVCQKKKELGENGIKILTDEINKLERKLEVLDTHSSLPNLTSTIDKLKTKEKELEKKFNFLESKQVPNLTRTIEDLEERLSNLENNSTIHTLTTTIDNLEKKYNLLIPINFTYTQLPNQSSPHDLWPTLSWTDVTKEYSGLFFRAEGSGSNKFEVVQNADSPRISNIQSGSFKADKLDKVVVDPVIYPLTPGKKIDVHPGGMLYQFIFNVTDAEVRPKNTAVKIWRRTK